MTDRTCATVRRLREVSDASEESEEKDVSEESQEDSNETEREACAKRTHRVKQRLHDRPHLGTVCWLRKVREHVRPNMCAV
jgi:hypothetical protein